MGTSCPLPDGLFRGRRLGLGFGAAGEAVHAAEFALAPGLGGVFFDDPFADFLVFNPSFEVGDDVLLGLLALFLDFGFGEADAGVLVVAPAEFGDGPAQMAVGAEFLVEFGGDFAVPMAEELGEAGGVDGGEVLGEASGDGLPELVGVGGKILGVAEEVTLDFPVHEAAGAPFAEVLLGEGVPGELLFEDGLNLGEGVEPGEEGFAGLGVLEAAVELFAEGEGEAGDFAVARGHKTKVER